jgi:NADH-quinone oxidoreductase subunit N
VYVFNAAVQSDLVWLVLVGVLNTAISAYYYLRVVSRMYLAPAPVEGDIRIDPWLAAAMGLTAAGVLVVGIVPTPLIEAAQRAVGAFA